MILSRAQFGLDKSKIEKIIDRELDKNADVLIGVDDPEVLEMISVLKESIAKVVSENNRLVSEEVENYIKEIIENREQEIVQELKRGLNL
jgi:Mg/Co/Ni transporter MgtE